MNGYNRFNELLSKYSTDKPKYSDFYYRHFNKLNPELILEIGVLSGSSLRAWQEIFSGAKIVGIDNNPMVKDKNSDLNIYIGDQRDTNFLGAVLNDIGVPDIVIDDGGHTRSMQVGSFVYLFPKLKGGGLYVIEDLETSYLEDWNDQELSTVEFLKTLIDPLDFSGIPRKSGESTIFNYVAVSIVFEPNICLLKKG